MDVKKKSKEKLENQVAGFLEYEKRMMKIDEKKSKELFNIFLNTESIIFSKEKTKEQLIGVLTSEEFDGIYEDYRKWLESSNRVKKDIIEKILPEEYLFLSNENYLKNYFLKYLKDGLNIDIEYYRNLIEKNIGILNKYNIKDKDLKMFVELIISYNSKFIEENLQLFVDNGITDVNDLYLLKDGMTWRSDRKEENLKSLNMLGITEPKDLVKLKKIIFSRNPKSTRINLQTLKEVGIINLDDLINLQEIIVSGKKYRSFIMGRYRNKLKNTSEDISECLKLLTNNGITSADNLLLLEDIIKNGKPENLKLILDQGIKLPSDLLSLENIIKYGKSENLKLILDQGIKLPSDLLSLEDIIKNGKTGNLSIFIDGKIINPTDLKSVNDIICRGNTGILKTVFYKYSFSDLLKFEDIITGYNNPEEIKGKIEALQSCGIREVDDLLKFKDIIIGYSKPEEIKEKIEVLKECGITSAKDLSLFQEIIKSYRKPKEIKKELDLLLKEWQIVDISVLVLLQQAILYGNISTYKEYFGDIKNGKINDIEMKVLSGIRLPRNLEFKENNHKGYVRFMGDIIGTDYDHGNKVKMIEKIVTLTFEEAENYLEIFKMFDESISMDIQRVKNELIDEVLDSEKPEETAKQIINIFEKNNLPLTGKIFKVFELLYPKDKFNSLLNPVLGEGTKGSPVLNNYKDEGKNVYELIYKDLMNIAIKSGDRSLKQYLKTFIGSEKLLRKFEGKLLEDGFNPDDEHCLKGLSSQEKEELLYMFRKISVLYNRYFGKEIEEGDLREGNHTVSDRELLEFYNKIKKGFNLREGKSIYDRLKSLLYANGLKYHSAEEVLEQMNKSKKEAHERGLNLYNESKVSGGKIKFPKGAFLKGVGEDAFSKIINRGVTCREYLGGGDDGKAAGSDCTPFDIDGLYLDSPVNWTGYGDVLLITDVNRSDIVDTGANGVSRYQENQYELFITGAIHENHYGIRTGIPMTEVDYVIYHGSFKSKEFQDICYEVARNGYYIPITDKEGNIKFTPEMYHKIRKGFNYMDYYDGFDVEQVDGKWVTKETDNAVTKEYKGENRKINDEELRDLIVNNSPTNEKYTKFAKENRELAENTIEWIKGILEDRCGIKFNSKYDSSITGAELHDSGSTGRGTDIPTKDVDLDFTLILDAKDYEKVDEISRIIHEEIGTQKDDDHGVVEGGNQIKSKINNIGKSKDRPNGVPLDLLILKKSQVIDYSSSDAMKEKLNFIASNPETGTEDLDFVKTNVIIMKKLLKAKGCYKKPEGGISGIGVENRITQHHGSFIEALESFEQVAYGGEYEPGKQPKPLVEFQNSYPIYDAGENYKDGGNDNFVYKLGENGYYGTLEIVKALRTKGLAGIRDLIKEYEKKKKEYTG